MELDLWQETGHAALSCVGEGWCSWAPQLGGLVSIIQRKKKHISINKFPGLSRDWVGGKILFVCVCVSVFRVIPNVPQKTRDNPRGIVYAFFPSCFFCAPKSWNSQFLETCHGKVVGPEHKVSFLHEPSPKFGSEFNSWKLVTGKWLGQSIKKFFHSPSPKFRSESPLLSWE